MGCEHCGGCGHGGDCESCGGCCQQRLSEGAEAYLFMLGQTPFLPVYRCRLPNGSAIGPFSITNADDSPHDLARTAEWIAELAQRGLATVDSDVPVQNADALGIDQAVIQRHFEREIERGSIALTGAGQAALDALQ